MGCLGCGPLIALQRWSAGEPLLDEPSHCLGARWSIILRSRPFIEPLERLRLKADAD
jgi:hypothetical protein